MERMRGRADEQLHECKGILLGMGVCGEYHREKHSANICHTALCIADIPVDTLVY